MTIKHLILEGGGPVGLIQLGFLEKMQQKDLWNIENIETIYSTSIGSFIGLPIVLKYNIIEIIEYYKNYPFNKIQENLQPINFLELNKTLGLITKKNIIKLLEPLFKAKDLSLETTMLELYNYTKIDFHIFVTELNSFDCVDINYKTFPDFKIIDAVISSSAIPGLISPVFYNDKIFFDGGVFTNTPLKNCEIDTNCEKSEILALINKYNNHNYSKEDLTLFTFYNVFFNKSITYCQKYIIDNIDEYENIFIFDGNKNTNSKLNFSSISNALFSKENRNELIEYGYNLFS